MFNFDEHPWRLKISDPKTACVSEKRRIFLFSIAFFAEVYVDITMRAAKASANNGWPVMELKYLLIFTHYKIAKSHCEFMDSKILH